MEQERFDELIKNEYLKFDRIPTEAKLSSYPDLCALLYLEKKIGDSENNSDILVGADHDIIWIGQDGENLTEEDAVYLARCGVHWDSDGDSLALFC